MDVVLPLTSQVKRSWMKEIYTLNPHHLENVHLACMCEDNWWYQVLKMYVWLDLRTFQVSNVLVVDVWCTDSWLVLEQLMKMVKLLFEDWWMLVSAHLVHQIELSIVHDASNSSFTIFISCSSTSQLSVNQTSTTKTSLTWNVLKSSQTYIFKTWYHQLSSYIHAKWTFSWWCGFNVYISFIHDLFTWDVNGNTMSNCTVFLPARKGLFIWLK